MTQMDELIARVEAATGPDRELDADIQDIIDPADGDRIASGFCVPSHGITRTRRDWLKHIAKRYTASIDSALTLVPEGWEW